MLNEVRTVYLKPTAYLLYTTLHNHLWLYGVWYSFVLAMESICSSGRRQWPAPTIFLFLLFSLKI
jgi:hypothetical protein